MENYLRQVKIFLDANPNEVVTLIIANKVKTPVMSKWKAVFDKSGEAIQPLLNFAQQNT